MANTLFDSCRTLFATAGMDWTAGTIKGLLIDTGYSGATYSSAWDYLNDIPAGARIPADAGGVNSGVTIGSRSVSAGACDGADITFTSVTGASCEAVLIFKDTGTESTSSLIAWIDSATGLPITPNGGDIIVTWDNGTNKIFRI